MEIDNREKQRIQRARKFYNKKRLDVTIATLDFGDYIFQNTICWEYKTINDFMSSINNNSVFHECYNQSNEYTYSYIIIIGDLKDYLKKMWNIKKIRKAWNDNYGEYLFSKMNMYYGSLRRLRTVTCPIEVLTEEAAFEEMLLQSEKCLDTKAYAGVVRPVPSQDPVDVLLCSVRGISTRKAESIRKLYNITNLYDLLNLTIADLKAVKGIGEKTAVNIYEFVHSSNENKV